MMKVDNCYVITDEFSYTPWNGHIFESTQSAIDSIRECPCRHLLYVVSLTDFLWQIRNRKISPKAVKAYKRTA